MSIRDREDLDLLVITDEQSSVLLRASNVGVCCDNQIHDDFVAQAIKHEVPVAGTSIVASEDLRRESPRLADQAYFQFIDTPRARDRTTTEETRGMMLKAAAPIFDHAENLIGVVYGGVLLNRNYLQNNTFIQDFVPLSHPHACHFAYVKSDRFTIDF